MFQKNAQALKSSSNTKRSTSTLLLPTLLISFSIGAMSSLFGGCKSTPSESESLTKQEAETLQEYKAELDVGRNMAGRLLQHFKSYENKEVVDYLNSVGQVLVANTSFSDRRFVFGILDTESINAFAVPGGYVLVTKGALRQAQSEAELAVILGHEIAHVGNRHVYDTLVSKMKEEKSEATEASLNLPETVKSRKRPESEANETASTLAKYIGGASGGQFNVLAAIGKGLGVLLEEGIDPNLEYEADLLGAEYALAAGYESRAVLGYFNRILKQKEASSLAVMNKTHPDVDSRIQKLKSSFKKNVPKAYKGAWEKNATLKL